MATLQICSILARAIKAMTVHPQQLTVFQPSNSKSENLQFKLVRKHLPPKGRVKADYESVSGSAQLDDHNLSLTRLVWNANNSCRKLMCRIYQFESTCLRSVAELRSWCCLKNCQTKHVRKQHCCLCRRWNH